MVGCRFRCLGTEMWCHWWLRSMQCTELKSLLKSERLWRELSCQQSLEYWTKSWFIWALPSYSKISPPLSVTSLLWLRVKTKSRIFNIFIFENKFLSVYFHYLWRRRKILKLLKKEECFFNKFVTPLSNRRKLNWKCWSSFTYW